MSAADATSWNDFHGLAEHYDCRPPYPPETVHAINQRLAPGSQGLVIEVGAGTGLFTRVLARELSPPGPILAIEPSADMRATAARATANEPFVTYVDGTAEQLAAENQSARLIAAAAAAQRFDRPRFYDEAGRVLESGGLIAFVQNSLDDSRSEFVNEYFALMEKHAPTYRRGWRTARDGSYQHIDYEAELSDLAQFTDVVAQRWPIVDRVDRNKLTQLVRTSTILKPAIERFGFEAIFDQVWSLFSAHANRQGTVDMTYVAELFIARRI